MFRPYDQEVFTFTYSNMTKGIAKSSRVAEVVEAIQVTLDPDGTKTTIPVDYEACCIGPRWSAFGYEQKYWWVVLQSSS